MKRAGNLYNKMLSHEMMEKVYSGVMKGKHRKTDPTSISFMIKNNKEYYLAECCRILEERLFKPSKPRESIRIDKGSGKLRLIQAPRLWPDQFVHWSIMLQLQPIFMRGMDAWCCASVKGRGTLYAKDFIEKCLDDSIDDRRAYKDRVRFKYRYCLKMDIRKYFAHIDRNILMQKLRNKIKDEEMLDLCQKIIDSVPGEGIPLGYYTSQWFANFYLQEFDHYLREVLMPKYGVTVYLRFMDDMIILGSNKRKLRMLRAEINAYLNTINLELKPEEIIDLHEKEVTFIGFNFTYGKTTIRENIVNNMVKARNRCYGHGKKFTIKNLMSLNSYYGWVKHSDTKQLFKELGCNHSHELRHVTEMLNKKKIESEASGEAFKHLEIEERIKDLKAAEEHDDRVLVRYYPNQDEARVVARCSYQFPDEEEYQAKKRRQAEELAEQKKKNAKARYLRKQAKKHANGVYDYNPTAEIFFGDRPADVVRSEYNENIRINDEIERQNWDQVGPKINYAKPQTEADRKRYTMSKKEKRKMRQHR